MDMVTINLLLMIFHIVVCVFVGILVLGMFVLAFKRKGRSALLLLPLGLWLPLWWSWAGPRQTWIYASILDGGLWDGYYLIWVAAERLGFWTCIVLPFLLIFKKDKPKKEEPPKPF